MTNIFSQMHDRPGRAIILKKAAPEHYSAAWMSYPDLLHSRERTLHLPYNYDMLTPASLVLVCLLPAPRDLEIARLLGWYRIPFRTAPKVVAVDYLAFYQPGSFGDLGGRIEYIAQVCGHELTTRAELLRDEPGHPRANEEYFKIQIGALEKLKQPILAEKWKRLTFLYTTGEYLLNAKTLNDLVVQSDERQLLWQSLRERAENAQLYTTDLPEVDIPPEVLLALLGLKEPDVPYGTKDAKEAEECEW